MKQFNPGMKVPQPQKQCEDKHCPFHSGMKLRGRTLTGTVIAKNVHKTATVEWLRKVLIPKYERTLIKRSKVRVHNPPCIDAQIGDQVKIAESRPISKTKNFIIIQNFGQVKGFKAELEAREEAKVKKAEKLEETKEEVNE
jgi:small subunit ribosomal protein S17